jgi:adenylate cyclase
VRTIVGTLVGRVQAAGAEHARRKPPASLAAYDCVLRGHALPWGDPQTDAEARRLYEKAIELDPEYGLAHALLALMMYAEWVRDTTGSEAALDRALELAKRAVELDENESYCHFMLGQAYLHLRSFDLAEHYHRRAVEMNPNNPEHLADMGGLLLYLDRPEEALEWLAQARRVDPYFGPAWYWHQLGMAYFVVRRYEDAIAAFGRSQTMPHWVHAWLGACHAYSGRDARAKECVAEALRRQPGYSTSICVAKHPFKNSADLDHLLAGLRKAGLPE